MCGMRLRWLRPTLQFAEKRTKNFRRTADDKSAEGVTMSCSEEFKISTFLVIIDSLLLDLDKRIKAYSKLDKLFSFLRHTDVEEVSLNGEVDFYSRDLEGLGQVEITAQESQGYFLLISRDAEIDAAELFQYSLPEHLHSSSSLLDTPCDELYR